MYNKTGEKIKGLAEFCAFVEILSCVIVSVFLIWFAWNEPVKLPPVLSFVLFFGGIGYLVLGILFYWLKYLFVAGYGELIEETTKSSAYLEQISNILRDTYSKENSGEKAVELQKTGCSYCGSKSELMFGDLCPDCTKLLSIGVIFKCSDCNTYYYKTNRCKCKYM